MTTDLKTSLLVNQQVPEYVRDEHPTFIAFLEAYYEFLETKQGTQNNDLVTQAKKLKNISDVDDSIEEFEQSFYNTYGSLIPLDVQSDKALLFKHLLPLYRIKGSESSFKLLFRLLFGEDIDIILPRNNVLKVSNSKWVVDNKLRINTDVYTQYVGDGSTKEFILAQVVSASEIAVYINDVEQSNSFFLKREYRKIIFNTAPANGSVIRVVYENFNEKLLQNRKVTGLTSGASAIIELSSRRIISDALNLGLPIELLINTGSLEGDFLNGEFVTIPIIDADGILLDVRASTFSIVKQVNIINPGFNYKVGDPVSINGGNATSNAVATVESVFSGAINRVLVFHGGATFTNASSILVSGNGNSVFTFVVDGIDQTGVNAANTFIVSTDTIASFNGSIHAANTRINAADYGFPNANIPTGENVTTRIIDSLSFDVLQVGPITNVKVLYADTSESTPILDAFGASYGNPSAVRTVKSLGTIARFKINDGGLGYEVGDEIVFGANPPMTFGQSAAAVVTRVAANGYIQKIEVANTRVSGTATISTSGVVVSGTDTKFTTELKVGDTIDINNQSRVIATITDPITMSVTQPWTYSSTNKKIGVFNYYPKGGFGYVQNNFPRITVSSAGGSNADIQIDSIASDNEQLQGSATFVPGAILKIKVLVPGSGYQFIPIATAISATGSGAILAPQIEQSYLSSDGRWTTSDSLLSTPERKIAGREYYVDYSYVISSKIEFYKYKKILKDLLHPVGFVNYAEYQKSNSFSSTIDVQPSKEVTLSGRVNVSNGSVVVTGFSTKFNIANQKNILTRGSRIAVNGELRVVNTIVSNTVLITSANLSDIWIANSGSGYSNGYLNISNGGGTITSLTIGYEGIGYSNGILLFTDADQSISAIANCEVFPSNGALRKVTLTKGGLFSNRPIASPDSYPANVIYANTITITNPGAGYSNGFLNFSDGDPLRIPRVNIEVYPSNGGIRTILTTGIDPGLYRGPGFPTVTPNTSPNVVVSNVITTSNGLGHSNGVLTFTGGGTSNRAAQVAVEVNANGSIVSTTILDSGLYTSAVNVASITANTGATGVNSFVRFTGGGTGNTAANARIFVNTAGYIVNVVVDANGTYTSLPTATVNTGNGILTITGNPTIYATVNNTPKHLLSIASNTVTLFNVTNVSANAAAVGANGYVTFTGGGISNVAANAQIYVNTAGYILNVVITSNGSYTSTPTAIIPTSFNVTNITANTGATGKNSFVVFTEGGSYITPANARIFVNTAGYIINVVITSNGSYTSAPIATPNTGNGVLTVTTNTVFTNASLTVTTNTRFSNTPGRAIANGYLVFTGGSPVINANVSYEVFPNTGAIRSFTINQVGLYRTTPNVAPNSVPYSITEVYPTDGGSGYANGYIILQGGEPMMNGNTSINDFTLNVVSIIANSGAVGVNSFVIFSGGGESNTPANARIFVNTQNYIVNVVVNANGTYSGPPTATVNTGNGVLTISSNISSNANTGYATTNANVQIIVNSTGAIIRTIITNVGLYANVFNVNLNGAVESIVANSGARTVNSWITLSNPRTYGNTRLNSNVANARIFVNTAGYVVNVAVFANGIYYGTPIVTNLRYYENTVSVPSGSGGLNGQTSNAAFTITMGPSTIYAANGVSQNGSGARFRISYNANTLNVANIAATLISNTLYTATFALTANSNSTTNAAFTVYPVSNVQTVANITVGFTGQNTPANVSVQVDANGSIQKLTINTQGNYYYPPDITPNSAGFITSVTANSGAVGVNSFVIFTGGGTSNVAANARIFVNTEGYIVNVVITSNGTYTSTPTATPNTGNGVLTVIRSGVDADLRINNKGIFTQTANNQPLVVFKKDPVVFTTEDSNYMIATEKGAIIILES